jgi:hypothetical protein
LRSLRHMVIVKRVGSPLNPTDRAIAAKCLVLPGTQRLVMAPPRRR